MIDIKTLSKEAQAILDWFTEYDGKIDRTLDFLEETLYNDYEDNVITPEFISAWITENKDHMASWFCDYDTMEDFETFSDLIACVIRDEAKQSKKRP